MEIVSGTGTHGTVVHCLMLCRELVRRGHQVTLVCPPGSRIARPAAEELIDVVPSDLHRWPPDELRRIATIVRERQIEVVHTHASRAHFFGVLLRWMCRVPTVATAHSRHFQLHWMFNDRVIAVSEADRRYQRTRNFVRPDRIHTIYNFIDHRRVIDVPADMRGRVRAWLGIGPDELLLGTVGRIAPRKGLIHLIRALPAVLAQVPHARLVVVGGDTQNDCAIQARSVARRLGVGSSICWAGHQEAVPEILSALDLYVQPSLTESFPLSVLEAMAAGLPVVATAVGGVPECVVAGRTGLLAPAGRSEGLAEAIVALLRDPERRRCMGDAGRQRVLENFTPDSQTSAIEAVFRQVAARKAA
jgi:glycosyltransferase involved in cell wall biosynthesis